MRRLLLLLPLLALLAACTSKPAAGAGQTAYFDPGKRPAAPVVRGDALDGSGPLDLGTYKGDVVVINFWASWCSPCRAEAGELVDVAATTKTLGVTFLGVDLRDDRDKAAAFAKAQGQ